MQLVQTLAISGSTMQLKNRVAIVAEAQRVAEEALPKDLATATMEFWDWCTARQDKPGWLLEHEQNEKSREEAARGWEVFAGPEWGTSDWHTWAILAAQTPPDDSAARKLWSTIMRGVWDAESHRVGEFRIEVGPRVAEVFFEWARGTDGYQSSFFQATRLPGRWSVERGLKGI